MQRIATHALRQEISSKEMFDRKINPNKTFSCTVCLFFLSHLSVCSRNCKEEGRQEWIGIGIAERLFLYTVVIR